MKFNDDAWFSNTYNAIVSGVDKEELLYLEINFLKLIDFRLMVDPQTFKNYYNHLVEISGWKAVLSNCSWLDPAHSYKIYDQMMKKRNENRMKKSESNLQSVETELTTSSKQYTQNSENSTSVHDTNSKRNCSPNSSPEHLRKDSFIDKNKIMEEELEIASNLVNLGRNTSFNPDSKMVDQETSSKHINHAFQINHEYSHYVRKSLSDVSVSYDSQYNSLIETSEYPTCKYEKCSKPRVDNFEHHRVSF